MDPDDLRARLREHRALRGAPVHELEWLVAHGTMQSFSAGEITSRRGQSMDSLWIVLSGHVAFYSDRGLGPRKVLDWRAGDITGLLPYSRMTSPPGEGRVIEAAETLMIHSDHFPALIRDCPHVTTVLVHVMLDRARAFTSSDLQDEKMASLGRMSAGLAHELNNPASAVTRSAKLLTGTLEAAEQASRALGAARISEAAFAAIERTRGGCVTQTSAALTPLERADREEALSEWLEAKDADSGSAAALVDAGVTVETLETLATVVRGPELAASIRWITAWCTMRLLTSDIQRAAARIHDLVGAIKRHTFMDRQGPESIDLEQGLRDSVTILAHKARKKSIAITVDVEPGLPQVRAIGSDINQVWSNLIDNAIDAAPESGRIVVSARRQLNYVIISVVDDGPGIPADIRDRIFDPFFTTKPVGQGTGQGLEIARRLAYRNGGDIEVESRPGRTEFRVSLPVANEATTQ